MQGARVAAALHAHRHHQNAHKQHGHEDEHAFQHYMHEFHDPDHVSKGFIDRYEKLNKVLSRKNHEELVVLDPLRKETLIKEGQVDGLIERAEARIEKSLRYYGFFALFVFAALYTATIALQLEPSTAYSMEFPLVNKLLDGLDDDTFALSSPNDFFEWFDSAILESTFIDPQCGDGVCESPDEYPSVGRFGCVLDCGANTRTSTISVKLEQAYQVSRRYDAWDLRTVSRRLSPEYRYNIYSEAIDDFLFEEDQTPNGTVTTEVPDGRFVLHAYQTQPLAQAVDPARTARLLQVPTPSSLPQRGEDIPDFAFGDEREVLSAMGLWQHQINEYCFSGAKEPDFQCFLQHPSDTFIKVLGSYGFSGSVFAASGRSRETLTSVDFCQLMPEAEWGLARGVNKETLQGVAMSCAGRRSASSWEQDIDSLVSQDGGERWEWLRSKTESQRRQLVDGMRSNQAAKNDHGLTTRRSGTSGFFGPCSNHSDCRQDEVDLSTGEQGMFCSVAGACFTCSYCQYDDVDSIDGQCPQELCPGSGSFPECIDVEALLPNMHCPSQYAFEVWTHHEPGTTVDVKGSQTDKIRYVTPSSRLVGPITVTQTRFTPEECTSIGNTDVKNFSGDAGCLSTDRDSSPFGTDPAFLATSSIYRGKLSPDDHYNASERVRARVLSATDGGEDVWVERLSVPFGFFPHEYDWTTQSMKPDDQIMDEDRHSFKQYFDERIGYTQAKELLAYLVEGQFLHWQTRQVDVELTLYNAELDRFAVMRVTFSWGEGGQIRWDYKLTSVPASLYGGDDSSAQSAMEIVVLVILGVNVVLFLNRVFFAVRTMTGLELFADPATWMEVAHSVVQIWSWVLWHEIYNKTSSLAPKSNFPVLVNPTASARAFQTDAEEEIVFLSFQKDVQQAADMMALYASLASISVLIFVFRLLVALDFQPKMNVITQTLASTAKEMAHLVALIVAILIAFASCGVLLFGHQFRGMSTIGEASKTLGLAVLTMDRTQFYTQMRHAAPQWAFDIYVGLFIILLYFLLLSMLLTVLVDAYINISDTARSAPTMFEEVCDILWHDLRALTVKKTRFMSDARLVARLATHKDGLPNITQLRDVVLHCLDAKEQIAVPGGFNVERRDLRKLLRPPKGSGVATKTKLKRDDPRVDDLMDRYKEEVPEELETEEVLDVMTVENMRLRVILSRAYKEMVRMMHRVRVKTGKIADVATTTTTTVTATPTKHSDSIDRALTKSMSYVSAGVLPGTLVDTERPRVQALRDVIKIVVLEAEKLPQLDLVRHVDPFCVLIMLDELDELVEDGQSRRTETIFNTRNPLWRESFALEVDPSAEKLVLTVFDEGSPVGATVIGVVEIVLDDLVVGTEYDKWFPLTNNALPKSWLQHARIRLKFGRSHPKPGHLAPLQRPDRDQNAVAEIATTSISPYSPADSGGGARAKVAGVTRAGAREAAEAVAQLNVEASAGTGVAAPPQRRVRPDSASKMQALRSRLLKTGDRSAETKEEPESEGGAKDNEGAEVQSGPADAQAGTDAARPEEL